MSKKRVVTEEYLDKKLDNYPTKQYLDQKLENYVTKDYFRAELQREIRALEIGLDESIARNIGAVLEDMRDQMKLMREDTKLQYEKISETLDFYCDKTDQWLSDHEDRISALEAAPAA